MRACISGSPRISPASAATPATSRRLAMPACTSRSCPTATSSACCKVTGGNVTGLGQPVAIADNFFKGGETVRGFAPLGFGPRDTYAGSTGSGLAVGGKNFVAGTAEVTFPMPVLPPDFGLRGAVFADAGMLFGVDNPRRPACTYRRRHGHPLVGRRVDHLGLAVRSDPAGFRAGAHQADLRQDAVLPLGRRRELLIVRPDKSFRPKEWADGRRACDARNDRHSAALSSCCRTAIRS